MDNISGWVVAVFALMLTAWYIHRKRRMSYFKTLGIPGPEPHLIYGNLKEIFAKGGPVCHSEWIKRYGKVVGYYFGAQPFLLVADPELLKSIEIKNFQSFVNRPPLIPGSISAVSNVFLRTILFLQGSRWKEIRSIITPTFSSSKLKQMMPLISGAVDALVKKVEEKAKDGGGFDIYGMYQQLTTDVIGQAAFGIRTNAQIDSNNPFVKNLRRVLRNISGEALLPASLCFPELSLLFDLLRAIEEIIQIVLGVHPSFNLISMCRDVIAARRKDSQQRRTDLLQLMLESSVSKEKFRSLSNEALSVREDGTDTDFDTDKKPSKGKVLQMSEKEVQANAFIFLFAGYETTSAALAFTTHCLVTHPEIQERVREEIKKVMEEQGKLDYNTMSHLPYLDQVFSESLRLYPPVYGIITREAEEEFEYNGLRIPKGTRIQVPVWSLHHDPEYWPDPYKFDPERFSPENRKNILPGVYQPFGMGPRNCVGMRLAQLEAKMALAHLLNSLRFVSSEKTEKGLLSLDQKVTTVCPKNGIHLKVVPLQE